jgi:hypothetical protein
VVLVIRCDKPNHAFGKGRHYMNDDRTAGRGNEVRGGKALQRNADSSSNVIET